MACDICVWSTKEGCYSSDAALGVVLDADAGFDAVVRGVVELFAVPNLSLSVTMTQVKQTTMATMMSRSPSVLPRMPAAPCSFSPWMLAALGIDPLIALPISSNMSPRGEVPDGVHDEDVEEEEEEAEEDDLEEEDEEEGVLFSSSSHHSFLSSFFCCCLPPSHHV